MAAFPRWLAAAGMLMSASGAGAQCGTLLTQPPPAPQTAGFPGFPGFQIAAVDHDGPGPRPVTIYQVWGNPTCVGCLGLSATSVAPWPELAVPPGASFAYSWPTLLMAVNEPVSNIPAGTLLIAGTYASEGAATGGMQAWNGTTSGPVGPPFMTGVPGCWTTWDPDGPGPQRPLLVVGGDFRAFRGTAADNIALLREEGTWAALGGGGVPQAVTQLLTHDFDGPGALPAQLVAITNATGFNGWSWDGEAWTQLNTHFDGLVVSHDPDGSGPLLPRLYTAVSSQTSAEPPRFFWWNGEAQVELTSHWPAIVAGTTTVYYRGDIQSFRSYDADGDGPAAAQLLVAGALFSPTSLNGGPLPTFAVLTESGWTMPFNQPRGTSSGASPGAPVLGLNQMAEWDPDGAGPRGTEVLMTGAPRALERLYPCDILSWDGTHFVMPLEFAGSGPGSLVYADLDGPGPLPTRLYAAGSFVGASGRAAAGLASYQSGRFVPEGSLQAAAEFPYRVMAHRTPSGADELVGYRGGGDIPLGLRYDGAAWSTFGQGFHYGTSSFSPEISDMVYFDPDGPGPQAESLFAVGYTGLSVLLRWDGTQWVSAGLPRPWRYMDRLLVVDPDGAGPQLAKLYAIGQDGLLRWTGWDWVTEDRFSTYVDTPVAVAFDPDGDGPQPTQLVVVADEIRPNGGPVIHGAGGWPGTTWHALTTTSAGFPQRARVLDVDGPGPMPPALFVVGSGLKMLQGSAWVDLMPGGGFTSDVAAYREGVEGPGRNELFVAATNSVQRIRLNVPAITQHPTSETVPERSTAMLTAATTSGTVSYRWYRSGAPVQNGPGGAAEGGGVVSGATQAMLTIAGVRCADAGDYWCTITNSCGVVATQPARLGIAGCGGCDADLTQDGNVDQDDLAALVEVIAGGPNPWSLNADFNRDGVNDQADVQALVTTIAGGPCP